MDHILNYISYLHLSYWYFNLL